VVIHPDSSWVGGKTIMGWHGPVVFVGNRVVVSGGGGVVARCAQPWRERETDVRLTRPVNTAHETPCSFVL
jgi:hypothetical protein